MLRGVDLGFVGGDEGVCVGLYDGLEEGAGVMCYDFDD